MNAITATTLAVEREVMATLVEYAADDVIKTVHLGALVGDDLGDGPVTLREAIRFLIRKSATWRAVAKTRGITLPTTNGDSQ